MAEYQLIIIGGGLSGLAAGIRAARFGCKTLILEQHTIAGGLNSYYIRRGVLLETGLHAMTNYAPARDRRAPLNRLFRQLKLSRRAFVTHQQIGSEIAFPDQCLSFSNDFTELEEGIAAAFPAAVDRFAELVRRIDAYDPFAPAPWRSTRRFLATVLAEPLLEDMLLLPLMVYGNAEEHDMDLAQFVVMFRAVFQDGFFRPHGTIRDFLDMLLAQYRRFDGEIRFRSPVASIIRRRDRVAGVVLADGREITADAVLSTIGIPGTARLSGWDLDPTAHTGRMSFMETICLVPARRMRELRNDRSIIFYNQRPEFAYRRPRDLLDVSWGVICFPGNFEGLEPADPVQIRVTNAANHALWRCLGKEDYRRAKEEWAAKSLAAAGKIIGNYPQDIVYQDSFTPLTIERFTAKAQGAVYGSPRKIRDGRTPWPNLFIAGTDQGYLGIVGAMLSGVTIVNQHLL